VQSLLAALLHRLQALAPSQQLIPPLADTPALLIAGLCLLGITGGALDLSMNTEATPVLSSAD
jgi:hypothetical protein